MSKFPAFAGIPLALFVLLVSLTFITGPEPSPAEARTGQSSPRVYFPDRPYMDDLDKFASRKGLFRVKLVGYQTTRWNLHSAPQGLCDGEARGHGFERVVFRSPNRKMKLSAFGEPRLTSMILPTLKVRGQMTRRGTYTHIPAPFNPDCPYGDGGGDDYVPPAPDCGTRKFRGVPMSLFALDGQFQLSSNASLDKHRPPYRNCPRISHGWPHLEKQKTNGKPIQTKFPGRLVFNRKFNRKTGAWSKVIVIARGARKYRTLTGSSVHRVEWTLTLKRLR
ncbi:MAG: hypothetical protein M3Y23_04015 [Actinomycetota bacterium]|nr:hypothetical protein [Actinomycetota bacterium]